MNINSIAESLLSEVSIASKEVSCFDSNKCKQVGRTIRKIISQTNLENISRTESTLFNGLYVYLVNKHAQSHSIAIDILILILGSYYFAAAPLTIGDKTIAHLDGPQLIFGNEIHQVFFADVEILAVNKNNYSSEVQEFLIWDNVLGFAGIAVDRKYIGQNRFCAGQLYCADVKKFKSKEEALQVYKENNNSLI